MSEDEIHKICEKYYIKNYTINSDLSINVDGNIDLNGEKLTELPLSFNVINGDFNCSINNLESLNGAPKEVNGSFICNDNKLTSLKHGPKIVNGDFNCGINNLESLKGAPKEVVNGSFLCNDNKLTSLEHGPKIVDGMYKCSFNKLKSLEGCPAYIYGDFICDHTGIKSFKGAPQYIKYEFSCYNNNIRTLKNCPKYDAIDLSYNPINEIFKLFIRQKRINNIIVSRTNINKERELVEYFNELDVIQKRGRATVVVLDRLNYFLQDIGEPEVDGSEIKRMKVLY